MTSFGAFHPLSADPALPAGPAGPEPIDIAPGRAAADRRGAVDGSSSAAPLEPRTAFDGGPSSGGPSSGDLASGGPAPEEPPPEETPLQAARPHEPPSDAAVPVSIAPEGTAGDLDPPAIPSAVVGPPAPSDGGKTALACADQAQESSVPRPPAGTGGKVGGIVASSPDRPRPAPPDPDDLLASLGRRFSGPALKMRFELRTPHARQLYRRDFVYISQQVHALEVSRRVSGLPRSKVQESLDAIGSRILLARTHLLDMAAEMRALIALNGQGDVDVEFTHPSVLHAIIVSPHARDFMHLLQLVDDATTQIERAWLLGLVDMLDRGRRMSECRKVIQGVKDAIRRERNVVGQQVRDVNAPELPGP